MHTSRYLKNRHLGEFAERSYLKADIGAAAANSHFVPQSVNSPLT